MPTREPKYLDHSGVDVKLKFSDRDIRSLDLTEATLTYAILDWHDLHGLDLTGADLTGADLTRANLQSTILEGANLTGANLTGADLTEASLRRANLERVDLHASNLTEADLTGAKLVGSNLTEANLTEAILDMSRLHRANLKSANLTNASLNMANLYQANLTNANLDTANMDRANLKEATLVGTRLDPANLFGADGSVIGSLNASSLGIHCTAYRRQGLGHSTNESCKWCQDGYMTPEQLKAYNEAFEEWRKANPTVAATIDGIILTNSDPAYGEVGREVASVAATCSKCKHTTESFGYQQESIRRCFAVLREECPRNETNFYVSDEELTESWEVEISASIN
jgi:uncharacterized protein YjbI with pentapeptide repeats